MDKVKSIEEYYAEDYFEKYQKEIGEFGGRANLFKFKDAVKESDTVLDFGCGGGFLLKNLNCKQKIGVEINPVARQYCEKVNGIRCLESIDEVPDESLDMIISNHCLEHVISPYEIFQKMYAKLKPGGRIAIVIPLDSSRYRWKPNDVNNHLYSFSPMNLGNHLQGCGFEQISTKPLFHKWPPYYKKVHAIFGDSLFHMSCWIYGAINRKWVQVKGEAVKK